MKHRPFLSRTDALVASTDWRGTPLGARETWPKSLHGYVSMVMAMPTPAIIFWGPDLTQIYNDGYAEIMGPRHPHYFGAPYRECWPDTYPIVHPWMRRVLDDGEVIEVERELIPVTRLGFEEDTYFTFTFSPLRDDDGRIVGILQPVFEVTENVLAQRRADVLRSLSTLPVRGLWDEAMKILASADADITEAVACEVQADGQATVVARTPGRSSGVLAPEALANLMVLGLDARQPVTRGRPRVFVLPLDRQDARSGRRILVVCSNPRLRETAAYLQFLEMVAAELSSALKRAEVATAEERQHAYLDRLFMQAPAGIAVLRGPQHIFELVNPMYRALIGHRDVRGLRLNEALPELADQPFSTLLDRVYSTGRPYVGYAEPVLLAREAGGSLEQVYFNYVYQPLHDAEQRPEGILVFCYEVTEQVRAQQQSEQLTQALRQEDRRKDEFLAMLAHELRNPLAPVKSASDLLQSGASDPTIVQRAGRIISRQVQHLGGLIDDLLDVSRVTRGLISLERNTQDLRGVLLDAVEQVRPLTETRSQRLLLDLTAQRLQVSGDHKRLVQVFANLLNNAAKYTPDGGQITLALQASAGRAEIAVIDNGIGIEPDLLPRVFDLFVQGDRSAARAAGGLGIGLSLARSLVEMHGGTVDATSAGAGQGSRFEVSLPTLDLTGVEPEAGGGVDARPVGRGESVLVVDDNVDAAQMLALQLQVAGYRVDMAHDGRAALRACAVRDYLACLVDIGLPDMHGTNVARTLKAGEGHVPLLVAVSGYGQESDIRLGHDAGFDRYFVKPVDVAPLLHLLHERAVAAVGSPVRAAPAGDAIGRQ